MAKEMGLGEWAARATTVGGPSAGAGPQTGAVGPGAPGLAPGAPEPAQEPAKAELTPEQAKALWDWIQQNKPDYAKALLELANAAGALKGFNPEYDPEAGSYVAEEMATGKYPPEQAIAVGLSRAREAGLKVPEA